MYMNSPTFLLLFFSFFSVNILPLKGSDVCTIETKKYAYEALPAALSGPGVRGAGAVCGVCVGGWGGGKG